MPIEFWVSLAGEDYNRGTGWDCPALTIPSARIMRLVAGDETLGIELVEVRGGKVRYIDSPRLNDEGVVEDVSIAIEISNDVVTKTTATKWAFITAVVSALITTAGAITVAVINKPAKAESTKAQSANIDPNDYPMGPQMFNEHLRRTREQFSQLKARPERSVAYDVEKGVFERKLKLEGNRCRVFAIIGEKRCNYDIQVKSKAKDPNNKIEIQDLFARNYIKSVKICSFNGTSKEATLNLRVQSCQGKTTRTVVAIESWQMPLQK